MELIPMAFAKRQRTSLVAVLAAGIATVALAQSGQNTTDDRGTLAWYARRAVEHGKRSTTIGHPSILYAEMEPLQDALLHTTAVVGQLLSCETNHDAYHIFTWRKYRTLEKLSSQSYVPQDALPQDVPQDMLPLAPSEFVLGEVGGTVNVDGVTITMLGPEGSMPNNEPRHLIFAIFRASGGLAVSNYGPRGMYWIHSDDTIHARVDSDTNLLWSDLTSLTNGHMSELRLLAAPFARPR